MLDKRKFKMSILLLSAVILLICGLFMIFRYFSFSKAHYVKYTEDSDLDYKVIYKENNFFNDGVLPNNKFIASLIDNVEATFKYNLAFLEKGINYKYKYKIVANISVLDNEDKEKLFEEDDIIYESTEITGSGRAKISQSINIDYNKYNDLVSNFKNTYGLKDAESKLKVSMYVELNSIKNNYIEDLNKKAVVSLSMPLTKKTTGIDLNSDLTKSSDRKVLIKGTFDYPQLLVIGVIELIISLVEIIVLIIYYKKTRTIKNIYDREIKKLLNTYEGYIQKISNKYEIGASQVIKIESFSDMLEIRDTLKTPILMLENDAKDGTFFIIPATNGIIYAYALRMVDIIARRHGLNAPDYDLKNIDKKLPKKYTTEYIDKQIEETRSLSKIDTENTIRGTKEMDEDLYVQLDKTITMKPVKIKTKRVSSNSKSKRVQKKPTREKLK